MNRLRSPFPKYVHAYRDRHGTLRTDFRRGRINLPLPLPPLSEPWWETYRTALAASLAGRQPGTRSTIGAERTVPGTCKAAFVDYVNSDDFKKHLSVSTQRVHANILRRWSDQYREHRIAHLRQTDFQGWLDKVEARSPTAAQVFRKVFRRFAGYCVSKRLIKDNPTLGVKAPKLPRLRADQEAGHHTWTEDEIDQYRHLLGTVARLALEIMLNLALRKADTVALGRQQMRDGMMHVTHGKTGWKGSIPINAELAAAIAMTPAHNMRFLVTEAGDPFSVAGFGNKFRDWREAAGLPRHCVPHGLRKACCRRLAEGGCTIHEIMAISGHVTLAEVQRYTKAADQVRSAQAAMLKTGTKIGEPKIRFAKIGP